MIPTINNQGFAASSADDMEFGIGRRARRLFDSTTRRIINAAPAPARRIIDRGITAKNRASQLAWRMGAKAFSADGSLMHDAEVLLAAGSDQLEYAKGRTKTGRALRQFGQFAAKNARQVGSIGLGIASTMVPGAGSTLLGGLAERLGAPNASPAGVVQAAQTPAEAAAVVQALAPSLPASARASAVQSVVQAQTPQEAAQVASQLNSADNKQKDKKKRTTLIIAGVAAVLVVVGLAIALTRKK